MICDKKITSLINYKVDGHAEANKGTTSSASYKRELGASSFEARNKTTQQALHS